MKKKRVRIVRLEAENIMKLRAFVLEPNDGVTYIGGKNGAGKSTALNLVAMTLGGKALCPSEPISKGKTHGESIVVLDNGLEVHRNFNKTRSGGTTSAVKVTNGENTAITSPQAMLNAMCNVASFDPAAFIHMDSAKQRNTLKKLIGLDNLDSGDAEREVLYQERTTANREIKRIEPQLSALGRENQGVPVEEISIKALVDELEKRREHNELETILRHATGSCRSNVEETSKVVGMRNLEIDALKNQLKKKTQFLEQDKALLATQKICAKQAEEKQIAFQPQDVSEIKAQLDTAEEQNAKAREENASRKERKRLSAELKSFRSESDAKTKQIRMIDEVKTEAIANAKMPIDGLGFDEEGVTFNDMPLDQASSAEQLRLSMAICAALNPTLGAVLIHDGSRLDKDSQELVRKMAEELDLQPLIEVVSEGPEVSIVIEDGMAKEPQE